MLDQTTLHVKGVSFTRHIDISEIEGFDLCMNLFRNAWLIGVRVNNGQVVKLPFWSRSFIRDDPRNQKLKELMAKIESAILDARCGLVVRKTVVDYRGSASFDV